MNCRIMNKSVLTLTLLLLLAGHALAQDEPAHTSGIDSAAVARKLSSKYPVERRTAAEELARLAAVEHRRLTEGYLAQEKDGRVRLALDWALYRMGKDESIFPLVRSLGEKKYAEQTVAYLKQLETPEPLYVFLERVNGNTRIRLLEVLAAVGDRDTLERIKPFTESTDPGIADAAKFAEREIGIRLEETPAVEPKRQRKVSSADDPEPPR
jgi:HEAT repeat protein